MTNLNDTRIWKPVQYAGIWIPSQIHTYRTSFQTRLSCPRSSNNKTLEFPSTFIKLWYACEELESNAKFSSFVGYFIDVRNLHDCYMKFDYVRISLTRKKYWYEIRDVLVPILHALWGISTNSSRREMFEVWKLRFNKAKIGFLRYTGCLNVTKGHTKHGLLQIQALIPLLNFLNCWLLVLLLSESMWLNTAIRSMKD